MCGTLLYMKGYYYKREDVMYAMKCVYIEDHKEKQGYRSISLTLHKQHIV